MLKEHDQAYAVNSMGQRLYIGKVPGFGDIVNIRKVEMQCGDKAYGVPHCTKLNAAGEPVEYRATVNGWVAA